MPNKPIPDYITPFVGYRSWAVVNGKYLFAAVSGWEWKPEVPMTSNVSLQMWGASFSSDILKRYADTYIPNMSNGCGIYAWKAPINMLQYDGLRGEVWLWGVVVEHEKGYRAQYGYPKRFVGKGAIGREMALRFGVPHISTTRFILERIAHANWRTCSHIYRRTCHLARALADACTGRGARARTSSGARKGR